MDELVSEMMAAKAARDVVRKAVKKQIKALPYNPRVDWDVKPERENCLPGFYVMSDGTIVEARAWLDSMKFTRVDIHHEGKWRDYEPSDAGWPPLAKATRFAVTREDAKTLLLGDLAAKALNAYKAVDQTVNAYVAAK